MRLCLTGYRNLGTLQTLYRGSQLPARSNVAWHITMVVTSPRTYQANKRAWFRCTWGMIKKHVTNNDQLRSDSVLKEAETYALLMLLSIAPYDPHE